MKIDKDNYCRTKKNKAVYSSKNSALRGKKLQIFCTTVDFCGTIHESLQDCIRSCNV